MDWCESEESDLLLLLDMCLVSRRRVDKRRRTGWQSHDDFVDKMMHRLYAGPPDDHRGRVEWLVELADFMGGTA